VSPRPCDSPTPLIRHRRSRFIGSAVVRHLLDDTNAFVVNIDKLTYASDLSSIPQASDSRYVSSQRWTFATGRPAGVCLNDTVRTRYESRCRKVTSIVPSTALAHFIQTNIVGTFTLLRGGATLLAKFHKMRDVSILASSRRTKCTAPWGPRACYGEDTLCTKFAVFGEQAAPTTSFALGTRLTIYQP
jgi:hypothetical protein